jgi:hypothetical protein
LGIERQKFGWASIQLDGGIEKVSERVRKWFVNNPTTASREENRKISVGFVALEGMALEAAIAFEQVAEELLAQGGGCVVTENSAPLLEMAKRLGGRHVSGTTLAYGQRMGKPGLHVMGAPTKSTAETITGLGATGVDLVLIYSDEALVPGNPVVPVAQISSERSRTKGWITDVDLVVDGNESGKRLWDLAGGILGGKKTRSQLLGNIAFQITRGHFGISL